MNQSNGTWKKWVPILEREIEASVAQADPANREGHGLDHMQRVWHMCFRLGDRLKADLETLAAAAFLHDLGILRKLSPEHGALSAELAEPVLERICFPQEKKMRVLHAIRVHDVTYADGDRHTLESRILYDADKTESFGVLGILRYIRFLYGRKPVDYILQDVDRRWNGICLSETRSLVKADYDYTRRYFQELKQALQ